MNETTTQTLLAELNAARQELLQVWDALDDVGWQTPVFADEGQWSVLDLARHLASAEHSMTRLMENIRQGGEGASAEFDLSRWNASQVRKQQGKSPDEVRADLIASRDALLAFIASLAPEDWEKRGRHGSGQVMSIYEITALIAAHEKRHLSDIRAALDAA